MSHNLDRVMKIRKISKDQITASKNFLENLINNLNLSVLVYDQDYVVKSINIISHSILDIELENVKGTPLNQWGNLYPSS